MAAATGYSALEYDVSGTAIVGGTTILSYPVYTTGINSSNIGDIMYGLLPLLPLTLNVAGDASTILSVVATSFTGVSAVSAALNWMELR